MSGISGGDGNRYTPGTTPGTLQGQADQNAYNNNNRDSSYRGYIKPQPATFKAEVPPKTTAESTKRSKQTGLIFIIALAILIYLVRHI